MPKRDDDDDDGPVGAWVLVTYHCYWSVTLHFVCEVDGKPKHDLGATSERRHAYRWQSYHAARKFQRTHPRLRGYVIVNLAEVERKCARQRQIDDERIEEMRAKAAQPDPPRTRR